MLTLVSIKSVTVIGASAGQVCIDLWNGVFFCGRRSLFRSLLRTCWHNGTDVFQAGTGHALVNNITSASPSWGLLRSRRLLVCLEKYIDRCCFGRPNRTVADDQSKTRSAEAPNLLVALFPSNKTASRSVQAPSPAVVVSAELSTVIVAASVGVGQANAMARRRQDASFRIVEAQTGSIVILN